MEGDLIRINEWLLPFSWLYGKAVRLRNWLFDTGILKEQTYNLPVICVGNLTVGGTGKTPHTEYLLRLLSSKYKVAVLSRGYKRKSKGYILAQTDTPVEWLGDEPFQMKQKFPHAYVAVDANRRRGITRLCTDESTNDVDVVLLDDAYQHRYVKAGLNILLVDYHRLISDDELLPAGRLREPFTSRFRAHIVIVTKCPADIKPMGFRVLQKALALYPYQKLFFSTIRYGALQALFTSESRSLDTLRSNTQVLLLTGIASPEQMTIDLERYTHNITPLAFADHHFFSTEDAQCINHTFNTLPGDNRIIITTEKDAMRLTHTKGLSKDVKQNLFVLPIEVEIMQNKTELFNTKILSYVHKNSRNSRLVEAKNAVKS